jgi:simple sugar transport system ATP-binding protein
MDGESLGALIFGTAAEPEKPFASKDPVDKTARPLASSAKALEVKDLTVQVPGRPLIRGLNLTLAGGEVLGIAGVRDSGLETLELALTGMIPSSGRIRINGRDLGGGGPRAFRDAGGAYLDTGRTGAAVAFQLPLWDTLVIHAHRRFRKKIPGMREFLDIPGLDAWASGIMKEARVAGSWKAPLSFVSGGMLQRILLAREFAEAASLLVLAEPGWGLDQRGRDRLFKMIRERARGGTGILLFSTDPDELLAVSDSILVLRNGVFADHIPGGQGTPGVRERIGRAMVGGGREGQTHD